MPPLNEFIKGGGTEETYFRKLDNHRLLLAGIIGVTIEELYEMGPELVRDEITVAIEDRKHYLMNMSV